MCATVPVEEAHRRPQHAVLLCGDLQQLLVGANRNVENGKKAAARNMPSDAALAPGRLRKVLVQAVEQSPQVAAVERDLVPVGRTQAALRRDQHAADDGLRYRRGVDGEHALDRGKLL